MTTHRCTWQGAIKAQYVVKCIRGNEKESRLLKYNRAQGECNEKAL